MTNENEKGELLTSYQWDLLKVVKFYHEKGGDYNDLLALILNVASSMAITADINLEKTIQTLEKVYAIALQSGKLSFN